MKKETEEHIEYLKHQDFKQRGMASNLVGGRNDQTIDELIKEVEKLYKEKDKKLNLSFDELEIKLGEVENNYPFIHHYVVREILYGKLRGMQQAKSINDDEIANKCYECCEKDYQIIKLKEELAKQKSDLIKEIERKSEVRYIFDKPDPDRWNEKIRVILEYDFQKIKEETATERSSPEQSEG